MGSYAKNFVLITLFALSAVLFSGCAEINPLDAPAEIIRHPFGQTIGIGMSKDEVISKWGEPDILNRLPGKDASGSQGEEWVYKARRYTPVPLDAGYLHKNKYLYFDGKNLVRISDKPKKK